MKTHILIAFFIFFSACTNEVDNKVTKPETYCNLEFIELGGTAAFELTDTPIAITNTKRNQTKINFLDEKYKVAMVLRGQGKGKYEVRQVSNKDKTVRIDFLSAKGESFQGHYMADNGSVLNITDFKAGSHIEGSFEGSCAPPPSLKGSQMNFKLTFRAKHQNQ